MNLHLTSTTTRIAKQQWDRRALAVGATVLGLTLVVGAATWQSAGRQEKASTGGVLSQPATTSVSEESTDTVSTIQDGGGQIVYIVRSQEQAAFMREAIAESGKIQAASGQRSLPAPGVLVTDLDASTIAAVYPRTHGTTFMDLRTP